MMMSAILELPEVRERLRRWSVREYERLFEDSRGGENVELIRGIIIQKMPKSPLHYYLTKWIADYFASLPLEGCVVRMEAPLRLADSMPEPDVAVVRGTEREFRLKHPATAELVVEIAAGSAALDRENASLYAEAGVPEYWIVLARQQQVEVHRRPESGVYQEKQLYTGSEALACGSLPAIQVPLGEWFA